MLKLESITLISEKTKATWTRFYTQRSQRSNREGCVTPGSDSRFSVTTAAAELPSLVEKVDHVVGVYFLNTEDSFHHPASVGIIIAQVLNNLTITVDCNSLSHEIFFNHVCYVGALNIFGMTSGQQSFRI